MNGDTIHATCVAIDGAGVLIVGAPGAGKSDLALRLIDRGATLISDDRTRIERRGGKVIAAAAPSIAGLIEVRGLGIVRLPCRDDAPVRLVVLLGEPVPRMPERRTQVIAEIALPAIALDAFEASTPIKIELALRQPEATPA